LRRVQRDDEALLRSGMEMFEALYQSMAADVKAAASTTSRMVKRVGRTRAHTRGVKRKTRS
jgi:hypothetical protein